MFSKTTFDNSIGGYFPYRDLRCYHLFKFYLNFYPERGRIFRFKTPNDEILYVLCDGYDGRKLVTENTYVIWCYW